MKHALEEDLLLKRFLLGELSDGERGEIEERLFADPAYFRQFRAAEDELTDEYLYGDLADDERERFESFFLTTPERRESFRIAKALKRYIAKNADEAALSGASTLTDAAAPSGTNARADAAHVPRPEKRPFFDFLRVPALRFSLAAAAVLIVAVLGLWLLVRTSSRERPDPTLKANTSDPQPTPTQLVQSTPEQSNPGPIAPPTPPENSNGDATNKNGGVKTPKQPRRARLRFYTATILPLVSVRGGDGGNEVNVPADADVVTLRIRLGTDGGDRYRVTLQTDEGERLKSWANLKPFKGKTGKTIIVNVPASTLTQQNYRLILAASNGDPSTFHFKVTRQ